MNSAGIRVKLLLIALDSVANEQRATSLLVFLLDTKMKNGIDVSPTMRA